MLYLFPILMVYSYVTYLLSFCYLLVKLTQIQSGYLGTSFCFLLVLAIQIQLMLLPYSLLFQSLHFCWLQWWGQFEKFLLCSNCARIFFLLRHTHKCICVHAHANMHTHSLHFNGFYLFNIISGLVHAAQKEWTCSELKVRPRLEVHSYVFPVPYWWFYSVAQLWLEPQNQTSQHIVK